MLLDILFNIILGLFISSLFSLYIYYKHNYVIKGPNSKDIVRRIYEYNGKFYRFVPEIYICPVNNIL